MNIITIEFNSIPDLISIQHNKASVSVHPNILCRFTVDTQPNNILCINNLGNCTVHIKTISMFDIGKDKLVYQGICQDQGNSFQSQDIPPGGSWTLDYTYPVFSWLHKTLNFGWLVAPDNN